MSPRPTPWLRKAIAELRQLESLAPTASPNTTQWVRDALDELCQLRADTLRDCTVGGDLTTAEEADRAEVARLDSLVERGVAALAELEGEA